MMNKPNYGNLAKGALAGFFGGLVASAVMTGFQNFLGELAEANRTSQKSKQDSKEETPANVKAAEKISETVFDHKLKKSERDSAGEAVHYAMGGVTGLIYGVAAEIAPLTTVATGLPFGAAVWLIADDVAVPALDLAKPPTEYPLSTNAYALSSHLIYGITTELVRRAVREVI